jgi:ribosomal S4/S9-like protein
VGVTTPVGTIYSASVALRHDGGLGGRQTPRPAEHFRRQVERSSSTPEQPRSLQEWHPNANSQAVTGVFACHRIDQPARTGGRGRSRTADLPPPGVHCHLRRKPSDYRLRLPEKQRLRHQYNLSEKQLRRTFAEALRLPGKTGEKLFEAMAGLRPGPSEGPT